MQIDGSKIRPFIEDIDFCEELLQEYKVPLSSFPSIELQRQLLLRHPKLLEYYDGYLELLFKDEDFARKIIESNNDILLDLNGYDIRSEYIRKFTIQLIKGEIKAKPGTELSKMEPAEIYYFSIPSVKNDTELAREFLKENISLFDSIENPEIKNDVNLMLQYLVKCPFNFPQYADKVKGHLTQEVTKAVIKFNFQNYKLIDENDPTMQLFYETLRRIKEVIAAGLKIAVSSAPTSIGTVFNPIYNVLSSVLSAAKEVAAIMDNIAVVTITFLYIKFLHILSMY